MRYDLNRYEVRLILKLKTGERKKNYTVEAESETAAQVAAVNRARDMKENVKGVDEVRKIGKVIL